MTALSSFLCGFVGGLIGWCIYNYWPQIKAWFIQYMDDVAVCAQHEADFIMKYDDIKDPDKDT